MKENILIVDDSKIELQMLDSMLLQNGYNAETAKNGDDALHLAQSGHYDLIITDVVMPIMDGEELIDNLNEKQLNIPILVLSGVADVKRVIKIMKMGVYDYIIKPINREEVLFKVRNTLKEAKERQSPSDRGGHNEQDHVTKKTLEWNIWKEQILVRDNKRFEESLFYNIKTNICQGAGIGTLVSLAELIQGSPKSDQGYYLVAPSAMKLIRDNNAIARKFIEEIAMIADISQSPGDFGPTSLGDLLDLIKESALGLKKFAKIGKHSIKIKRPDQKNLNASVQADSKLLTKCFEELLVNAFKFSRPDTDVLVEIGLEKQYAVISFLNIPRKLENKIFGIPIEYERLVFEPFFRICNTLSEEYEALEMGLGLSAIKRIINKHNGQVSAFNSMKEGKSGPQIWVKVILQLPLAD